MAGERRHVRFVSIEVEGDTAGQVMNQFASALVEAYRLAAEGKDVDFNFTTGTTSTTIKVRPK